MLKTTAMEKVRGVARSEMWNQVLLGNGRAEDSGGACPQPTHHKFQPHPISWVQRSCLFRLPWP